MHEPPWPPAEPNARGRDPVMPRDGVSVLIPVLDEADHVEAMLDGLAAQRLDRPVEYLLIDGGSTDGTRDRLAAAAASDPRLRLLDNPERNIPAALNLGLRHASGRYVARMDAHTRYPPVYLAEGVRRLEVGDVQWVGGPALPHGVDRWSRRVALALETRLGVGGAAFRRATQEIETDTAFTGILLREVLEQLGGWDPESLVNEDAELAARLRAQGGRIVCTPAMAARYVPRSSLDGLARQYFRYGTYRARTSGRHPESMRRSNLLPPALVATGAAAALAPRHVRRPARLGLVVYAIAVLAVSAAAARRAAWRDAAALPAVFATMHLSWGVGFLAGCLRFGPPWAAVRRALSPGPARRPGGSGEDAAADRRS